MRVRGITKNKIMGERRRPIYNVSIAKRANLMKSE